MDFHIRAGNMGDAGVIAENIAISHRDVAERFSLTKDNCPTHPSFYTPEKVTADMEKGLAYFIAESGRSPAGCVAIEQPDEKTSYLERLSVIPRARRQGLGRLLVEQVFSTAADRGLDEVGIAIIAAHVELRRWYEKIGFVVTEKKSFPHLPFDVIFLTHRIKNLQKAPDHADAPV